MKASPTFTQKHYVLTAKTFSALLDKATGEDLPGIRRSMAAFIELFTKDNPKFQPFTFIEACNVYQQTR